MPQQQGSMPWLSSRQRKILQDMGIQVWSTRGHLQRVQAERDIALDLDHVLNELVLEPKPEPIPELGHRQDTETTSVVVAEVELAADQPATNEPVVDPFELNCAYVAGQMLVWEVDENSELQGFACDLLAAMANNWRDPVEILAFRWPLTNLPAVGAIGDANAVSKVVAAFLAKQIEDISPARVFATQAVLTRLQSQTNLKLVACPNLVEMAASESVKRQFWQLLRDQ